MHDNKSCTRVSLENTDFPTFLALLDEKYRQCRVDDAVRFLLLSFLCHIDVYKKRHLFRTVMEDQGQTLVKMSNMPTRQLGKNGPQVSALGLGAIVLPGGEERRFKLYDRAIELGCTFFDSGDIYGDSEDSLGKYFQTYPSQREKVSTSRRCLIASLLFNIFFFRCVLPLNLLLSCHSN